MFGDQWNIENFGRGKNNKRNVWPFDNVQGVQHEIYQIYVFYSRETRQYFKMTRLFNTIIYQRGIVVIHKKIPTWANSSTRIFILDFSIQPTTLEGSSLCSHCHKCRQPEFKIGKWGKKFIKQFISLKWTQIFPKNTLLHNLYIFFYSYMYKFCVKKKSWLIILTFQFVERKTNKK